MSMICLLRPAPDADITHLLAHSAHIHTYLHGEEPAPPPPGFFARLFGKKPAPPPAPALLPPPDSEEIDLDKAWHGIHYLLVGDVGTTEPPLDFLLSGTEIGEEDLAYGFAHAFRATEVRAIYAAVKPLTPEVLRPRYNPRDMMEQGIYPEIWEGADDDEQFDYLMENYACLRDFLAQCIQQQRGMIIYLS